MKKFVIKATALAIGALVGTSALAADLDITTTVLLKEAIGDSTGAQTYAKELTYAALTGGATKLNFKTDIGFGVSNGQTRYIRIDLTNAKFTGNSLAAAPVAATDLEIDGKVDLGADGAVGGAGGDADQGAVALVQGGATGQAYAVFQITAGGDISASEEVRIKLAELNITSTAASASVRYSLHETATSAQGATSSNTALLSERFGYLAKFATGLVFTVDNKFTSTANVEESFKLFKDGGGEIGATQKLVKLAEVTLGTDADVKESDGSAVDMNDLVAAGTKIVVSGDFSVRAGADDAGKKASVYLSDDDACATGGTTVASNTVPSVSGAEFVTGTNTYAAKAVCYAVDGTSAIPAFDAYKARVDVVAAASTTTANVADKDLGKIERDGTELHAPFATIYSGTGNRAVLTSTHTADANVAASVITETGVTCTGGSSSFTLKAGKQLFINASDVCPTLSAGTRFALKLIIAAPNSKIYGVYNSYTYDAATAKVTDLSSYPLQRPAAAN